MANLKSSKKRAKQAEVNRKRNLSRKTAIKTAIKKVNEAIQRGEEMALVQALFREVEAQVARAKNKRTIHRNTAKRKISRVAKKIASKAKA